MPIQGFVKRRKHQFGRQTTFGTRVAAKRAYPFKGVPTPDRSWTDPEVDAGTIDPTVAPYLGAPDLTASLNSDSLEYNNIPIILSGFFGGGITPSGAGTAKTWVYNAGSVTADAIDAYTYEFGDDVTTDWYQFGDGIIENFEISGPEGLGPLSASTDWRFGSMYSSGSTDLVDAPVVPTASLAVDTAGKPVYLKDGAIYIATTSAGLGAGQISDALHTFTLRGSTEVDQKRWANGDQSFNIDGYGRTSRSIEIECTFAKTASTVGVGSESDAWMSNTAVNRYVRLTFTSTAFAEGAVPFSWTLDMPFRYYTRTEGEVGGNTVVVLTGHAFYDPGTFAGVFKSTTVNTLTSALL